MTTQNKIQEINQYVESYFQRFGLTTSDTINIKASFKLSNYNQDFSNAFQVDSESQAKEILKEFITVPFIDDIFKSSMFDESKDLFLYVDLQLPKVY